MGSSTEAFPVISFVAGLTFLVSLLASSAQATLAALGEHRLEALAESRGRLRKGIERLVARIERIRLSLQILDTASKLLLGTAGILLLGRLGLGGWTAAVWLVGAFLLVLAQTSLRALVSRDPERHVVWVGPLALALDGLALPISGPLSALARAIRGRGERRLTDATEEIEYLIEKSSAAGAIDEEQRDLLESVIEFSRVRVREIMVPRPAIVALPHDADYDQVVRVIVESGYSRIPVFEESIDQIVGILYAKKLLEEIHRNNGATKEAFRLADHLAPPFFIPETMRISHLLTEFQRRNLQLAVVVDEFGGTAGLVTLEDVVEEIVGEIRDESDREEQAPIRLLADGLIQAEGGVSIRDLEDFVEEHLEDWDLEFPEDGDYETVGGFVTSMVGHVPKPGETLRHGDFVFTVRAADQRRVARVEIAWDPLVDRGEEKSSAKELESGAAPAARR
ncbi:MAG TPA: hemolysin family protein [Fredinandcohnia sp.]|nr:hemolysin family protein [Fredinandcohnia sp.]